MAIWAIVGLKHNSWGKMIGMKKVQYGHWGYCGPKTQQLGQMIGMKKDNTKIGTKNKEN